MVPLWLRSGGFRVRHTKALWLLSIQADAKPCLLFFDEATLVVHKLLKMGDGVRVAETY